MEDKLKSLKNLRRESPFIISHHNSVNKSDLTYEVKHRILNRLVISRDSHYQLDKLLYYENKEVPSNEIIEEKSFFHVDKKCHDYPVLNISQGSSSDIDVGLNVLEYRKLKDKCPISLDHQEEKCFVPLESDHAEVSNISSLLDQDVIEDDLDEDMVWKVLKKVGREHQKQVILDRQRRAAFHILDKMTDRIFSLKQEIQELPVDTDTKKKIVEIRKQQLSDVEELISSTSYEDIKSYKKSEVLDNSTIISHAAAYRELNKDTTPFHYSISKTDECLCVSNLAKDDLNKRNEELLNKIQTKQIPEIEPFYRDGNFQKKIDKRYGKIRHNKNIHRYEPVSKKSVKGKEKKLNDDTESLDNDKRTCERENYLSDEEENCICDNSDIFVLNDCPKTVKTDIKFPADSAFINSDLINYPFLNFSIDDISAMKDSCCSYPASNYKTLFSSNLYDLRMFFADFIVEQVKDPKSARLLKLEIQQSVKTWYEGSTAETNSILTNNYDDAAFDAPFVDSICDYDPGLHGLHNSSASPLDYNRGSFINFDHLQEYESIVDRSKMLRFVNSTRRISVLYPNDYRKEFHFRSLIASSYPKSSLFMVESQIKKHYKNHLTYTSDLLSDMDKCWKVKNIEHLYDVREFGFQDINEDFARVKQKMQKILDSYSDLKVKKKILSKKMGSILKEETLADKCMKIVGKNLNSSILETNRVLWNNSWQTHFKILMNPNYEFSESATLPPFFLSPFVASFIPRISEFDELFREICFYHMRNLRPFYDITGSCDTFSDGDYHDSGRSSVEDMMTHIRQEHESTDEERFQILKRICPMFILLACLNFDPHSLVNLENIGDNDDEDYMDENNSPLFNYYAILFRKSCEKFALNDSVYPSDLKAFKMYVHEHYFTGSVLNYNPPKIVLPYYRSVKLRFEQHKASAKPVRWEEQISLQTTKRSHKFCNMVADSLKECCMRNIKNNQVDRRCIIDWLNCDIRTSNFVKTYDTSMVYLNILSKTNTFEKEIEFFDSLEGNAKIKKREREDLRDQTQSRKRPKIASGNEQL